MFGIVFLNFTNLKYDKKNRIILTADTEYISAFHANCGIAVNFLADMRKLAPFAPPPPHSPLLQACFHLYMLFPVEVVRVIFHFVDCKHIVYLFTFFIFSHTRSLKYDK